MRIKFILVFIFLTTILNAQNDTAKIYELQQITVTSTKFEQLLRNFTPSYSIIPEGKIKQDIKPSLLASISGKIPSLFITENGLSGFGIGSQAAGKISIRGVNGIQQTLIVVDGRPEFAGIFGHPIADIYQSSEIAAVDVLRGPSSVIFGTNAMGGVINITTKKTQLEGIKIFTDVNYGSFDTYKIKSSIDYKRNKFISKISISKDYSNDNRPSSSFHSISGIYNASYLINQSWSIDFNAFISSTKSFNPGPVTKPYKNDSVWTDITRANTSLSLKNKYDKYEGSVLLFFNNGVHDVFDGFHSNDNTLGLIINESFEFIEKSLITLGADIKRYAGSARNKTQLIDKHVIEKSLYVLLSKNIFNRISFSGGVRLNNHSVYGTLLIPQFNLSYQVDGKSYLYISAAEGFRNPTLNELFLFGANIDLKPEKIWNYEIGFKSKLLQNKLLFNGAFYLIEGKDFINMVGVYPNIKNQNVNKLTNRGFEIEASYILSKSFTINGNYSYIKNSTKLIGVPQQQFFAEANYIYKIFSFNVGLKTISNLYTSVKTNNSVEKKQSYALLNASMWVNLVKSLSMYLKLDNLLNRQYEIMDGYPMPGRTFLLGFSFDTNL
ncbi:MAG: TonB-dependent receptor [Melioribacter sp.]|uniref:TonB-dependent receptor n=1 Tax=Rosettibacter primus TaxID=3111523 RepID=UPI00247D476F|nr:TonB-dependent receptor [Melioribacter sp.]